MSSASAFEVFGLLDPPLWLVTAQAGGLRGGLIATFVNQASIVPGSPRVVVGLARQHHTWRLVNESACFALHLLGEEQLEWVWRFGLASGNDWAGTGHADKFAGLDVRQSSLGNPLVEGSPAWLDCRVETRLETGDRTVFLGAVADGRIEQRITPLTMGRMIQLAPKEKLQELKRLMERDQSIDAEAIRSWRSTASERDTPSA